jgi:hypothetical protein
MSNPSEVIVEGLVVNPATLNVPDGQNVPPGYGKQGEQLTSDIHSPQYAAALRQNLFTFNVTAVTTPHIAATLVSVFSLYNPPSSGKVLELVDMDVGLLSATTVIDVLGLYWQGAPASGGATFSTPAVFGTNVFGGAPGKGQPSGIAYTSLTHAGTPVRIEMINSWNSTSTVVGLPTHYEFKGKRVLYPGDLISAALSTTAWTGTSMDLGISWAEWPYPN